MKARWTIAAALALSLIPGTAYADALPMPYAADADAPESREEQGYGEFQGEVDQMPESWDDGAYAPSGGLTMEGGVNYFGGRIETWYSSQALYHWRTPEWWTDEEGFYRTPEGYYVVAASDYDQGAVIEGSKGPCQVLDCGCPDGVTDYYVEWAW